AQLLQSTIIFSVKSGKSEHTKTGILLSFVIRSPFHRRARGLSISAPAPVRFATIAPRAAVL
ncbi:MAG: hypothetical protein IJ233_12155, partial [Pyramidobacter sp.]|nr:hypothetical protein [Pyramidobacter sp.]